MTQQFDRRRILSSLTGSAALASIAPAISKQALAIPEIPPERAERHYCWYLAQQRSRTDGPHSIDFWSMPRECVRYEKYLPPQIGRGVIGYEDFPRPIDTTDKALEAFIKTSEFYARDWLNPATLDRFAVEPANGPKDKDFQTVLTSFVGEKDTSRRTALLDVETTGGLDWFYSAFASCYHSLIGLYRLEDRGFVQHKRYYRRSSESAQVRVFLRNTSGCDTVIVTSSGLLETDDGLCPRASTEDLVGELVRRLSYALMQPKILERITRPSGTKSKPRYFALGSATLNAPFAPLLHLQMMLDRQSEFVSAGFAPLASDDLPLFMVTSKDDDPDLGTGVTDVLARAASISGYEIGPEMFAALQAPRYQPETRRPGGLDLIALWPFMPE